MIIQNPLLTGSLSYNGADLSNVTSSNANSASVSLILTAVSSSNQQLSASYIALSASYNVFSGSASTRITTVSSSQQDISASLLQVSASYIALSASYNTFSGSASTRVTKIENNYATTGSNSFRADQSITGSLVVSSTITAQTLVVQTVTSSIVYSSGSNIFGSALGDRQTFTGSIQASGSSSHFLMGGSVGIGITNPTRPLQINAAADTRIVITDSNVSTTAGLYIRQFGSASAIVNNSNGTFQLATNDTYFLTANASGQVGIGTTQPSYTLDVAGTGRFTGQLIASSTSGGTAAIFQNTGAQNSNGIELRGGTTGTTVNWKIEKDNTVSNAFQLTPSTTNGGSTYTTPVLTIASTGAATFSSSVTAAGIINGSIGVSIGANALGSDRMFQVSGNAFTSGATQFGIVNNPTMTTPTTIYGYYGGITVTSATNAYGMYIVSNSGTITNKFGLYQEGTNDKNYFGGIVGIGTTSPGYTLDVNGTGRFSSTLNVFNGNIIVRNDTASTYRGLSIGATTSDAAEYGYIKYEPNVGELKIWGSPASFGGKTTFWNNDIQWLNVSSANALSFTGATTFSSTITATGATIASDVVGDPVYLRVRNNNTGGYPSSLALSIYGYSGTAAYFDALRIQASYPGYGSANFYVKYQSTSADVNAISIRGDGFITFNSTSDAISINHSVANKRSIAIHKTSGDVDDYYIVCDNIVANKFLVTGGGTIYAVNTTVQSASDIRFKENIRDLETGLSEILSLKPRRFDWKEGKGMDIKNAIGFVAQEVEEVLPDLVKDDWINSSTDSTSYKSLGMTNMIPTLVKAIQELQATNDNLQAQINELKAI